MSNELQIMDFRNIMCGGSLDIHHGTMEAKGETLSKLTLNFRMNFASFNWTWIMNHCTKLNSKRIIYYAHEKCIRTRKNDGAESSSTYQYHLRDHHIKCAPEVYLPYREKHNSTGSYGTVSSPFYLYCAITIKDTVIFTTVCPLSLQHWIRCCHSPWIAPAGG